MSLMASAVGFRCMLCEVLGHDDLGDVFRMGPWAAVRRERERDRKRASHSGPKDGPVGESRQMRDARPE